MSDYSVVALALHVSRSLNELIGEQQQQVTPASDSYMYVQSQLQ